jgi:hypothetical protein
LRLGSWEAGKPAIFFDLSVYQHSSLQAFQPSSALTVSYLPDTHKIKIKEVLR